MSLKTFLRSFLTSTEAFGSAYDIWLSEMTHLKNSLSYFKKNTLYHVFSFFDHFTIIFSLRQYECTKLSVLKFITLRVIIKCLLCPQCKNWKFILTIFISGWYFAWRKSFLVSFHIHRKWHNEFCPSYWCYSITVSLNQRWALFSISKTV